MSKATRYFHIRQEWAAIRELQVVRRNENKRIVVGSRNLP